MNELTPEVITNVHIFAHITCIVAIFTLCLALHVAHKRIDRMILKGWGIDDER